MLPKLAAMVWSTTTGSSSSSKAAICSTVMAKGTKVIRATSLVTSMLEKKHSPTRIAANCRPLFAIPSSVQPMRLNTPSF